jgi:hypothetical protein
LSRRACFLIPYLQEFFTPRFHFGGQVSTNGHTSYAYAGLLFTYNLTQRIFLEPFVGIAFSDGSAAGDANHNPIGCTTLIHSGGNIGSHRSELERDVHVGPHLQRQSVLPQRWRKQLRRQSWLLVLACH